MRESHARIPVLLLAVAPLALLLACGPAVPDYHVVQTPSGRPLKLEGVWPTNVGDEPALLLAYHSDVDLSDASALRAEVQDAWAWLRPRVEAGGQRAVIIRASLWERPGWRQAGRAAEFVILRERAGTWRIVDTGGS